MSIIYTQTIKVAMVALTKKYNFIHVATATRHSTHVNTAYSGASQMTSENISLEIRKYSRRHKPKPHSYESLHL